MSPAFHSIWSSLSRTLRRRRPTAAPTHPPMSPQQGPAPASPAKSTTLSREELALLAVETITAVGARGPVDHERVMGALMPRVKGRGSGAEVSAIVTELLAHQEGLHHQ